MRIYASEMLYDDGSDLDVKMIIIDRSLECTTNKYMHKFTTSLYQMLRNQLAENFPHH